MQIPTMPTEIIEASHAGLILNARNKTVSFDWYGYGCIDNEDEMYSWALVAEWLKKDSTEGQLHFNY